MQMVTFDDAGRRVDVLNALGEGITSAVC